MNISTVRVISQSLYAKLGYSLERDLAPAALLAYTPLVVTGHNGIGAKRVSDLVAAAKTTKIVRASGVPRRHQPFVRRDVKMHHRFDAMYVPYKGNGAAIVDMMSDQANLLINGVPDLLPTIKFGRIRALATMADKRHPNLPDVSTMAEQGHQDFVLGNWVGVVVPMGTPQPVIDQLYNELARWMNSPDVAAKIAQQGFDPALCSPAEFARRLKTEITRFAKAMKESGARID